jgi:hypothetical protein
MMRVVQGLLHLGKLELNCYCIRHAEKISEDDPELPCL